MDTRGRIYGKVNKNYVARNLSYRNMQINTRKIIVLEKLSKKSLEEKAKNLEIREQ